jgi:hypothetical protein
VWRCRNPRHAAKPTQSHDDSRPFAPTLHPPLFDVAAPSEPLALSDPLALLEPGDPLLAPAPLPAPTTEEGAPERCGDAPPEPETPALASPLASSSALSDTSAPRASSSSPGIESLDESVAFMAEASTAAVTSASVAASIASDARPVAPQNTSVCSAPALLTCTLVSSFVPSAESATPVTVCTGESTCWSCEVHLCIPEMRLKKMGGFTGSGCPVPQSGSANATVDEVVSAYVIVTVSEQAPYELVMRR